MVSFARMIGNLQILLQDLQERHRVEILLADARADLGRQIVQRERERLDRRCAASRLMIVSSERRRRRAAAPVFSSGGRWHLRDFDVGDAQLANAFLQLLEESRYSAPGASRFGGFECDERAFALDLDEQIFADELAQRLAQRDAADASSCRQVVLRRDLRAGPVLPVVDAMAEEMLDLVIQGDARVLCGVPTRNDRWPQRRRQHTICG